MTEMSPKTWMRTIGAAIPVLVVILLLFNGGSGDPAFPGGSLALESSGAEDANPVTLPPGMSFVSIPAGSFQMGSPTSEQGRTWSEEPLHTVNLPAFEMMTTEVTQGMWEEVMGTSIQDQQRLSEYDSGLLGTGGGYPMYFVSWYDCLDFIDALNAMDPAHSYRLPSEAEWEYACRSGTATAFYWGSTMNWSFCWCDDNSGGLMHPVGQKQPNAWGLYDMSGNAWEWCQDCWHDDYNGAPENGASWELPWSEYRVFRGGSWFNESLYSRSAYRYAYEPDVRYYVGFRLARSVDQDY
jgi:formylglycine-generating enzyme required for sulfatase activity